MNSQKIKYCRYCGNELSGATVFCNKCGKKLLDDPVTTIHNEVSATANSRNAYIAEKHEEEASSSNKKASSAFIILDAILLWIATGGIFIVLFDKTLAVLFILITGIIGIVLLVKRFEQMKQTTNGSLLALLIAILILIYSVSSSLPSEKKFSADFIELKITQQI